MGLISLLTPTVGLANATEDPKVASDIVAIGTLVNGNLDLVNLSSALQAQLPPATWTAYTPTLTAAGFPPIVGNGAITGTYIRFEKTCAFAISFVAGSSTTGGGGALTFGLPVSASPSLEQNVLCKFFAAHNGSNWMGFGVIAPSSSVVAPYFPLGNTQSSMGPFQNDQSLGGDPQFAAGSTFACSGVYQTS